ncbi:unnamed protein product, partial [Didymodactylos carnosus]
SFRDNAEHCCDVGKSLAETKSCDISTIKDQTNGTCRYLMYICCLSKLRIQYCEEGVKTALRLLPCNETSFVIKDTHQMCCTCCELGVKAGRDKEDCEPLNVLEEGCGEQFQNCCKKAKSLICDSGFELGDEEQCRDIDECLTNPCAKTMKCENIPGSYICVEGCKPGYRWNQKYEECRGIVTTYYAL